MHRYIVHTSFSIFFCDRGYAPVIHNFTLQPHTVKGRQAKLCEFCSQVLWAHQIEYDQKMLMRNVTSQRRRQDLVRVHETRHWLRRPRPLSDLWEANTPMVPEDFPIFSREIWEDSTGILLKCIQLKFRPWTHWGLPYSKPHETAL